MILSIYMDITDLKKKYSDTSIKEKKEGLEQRMQNAHGNGENMSQLSMDLGYYSQLDSYIDSLKKNIQRYAT